MKGGQQEWETRDKARREQNFYQQSTLGLPVQSNPGPPNSNGLLVETYHSIRKNARNKHNW